MAKATAGRRSAAAKCQRPKNPAGWIDH